MLAELAGTASPHGGERRLAEAFAGWAAAHWPFIDWQVRPLDGGSASILATASSGTVAPADVLLYSHLDTSLTGDPLRDAAITGRDDPVASYAFDGDVVSGLGLGVAKGPAAAAVVGFVRAAHRLHGRPHHVQLLLSARGTHRWAPDHRTGITEYLAALPPPRAAVVAKGGPAGVLRQEPAALYLRVRLDAGWGPLMLPGALRPAGGLLSQAGPVLATVEAWGAEYAADAAREALRADPSRQDGAAFGVGSVRAGSPEKPDLAPAALELYCYLVVPGPVSRGAAAASLAKRLGAFDGVRVDEQLLADGPATPADAPIVRVASDAYLSEFPAAPPIAGWTGSTDGVVLRAAGVPTARLGPRPLPAGDDPRIDAFELAELARFARVYERIVFSAPTPVRRRGE